MVGVPVPRALVLYLGSAWLSVALGTSLAQCGSRYPAWLSKGGPYWAYSPVRAGISLARPYLAIPSLPALYGLEGSPLMA